MDVTSGYGPEIYSSPSAQRGLYQVYANYFGGAGQKIITQLNVAIITNEGSLNEKQQLYQVPMRKPGELTFVTQFVY